MPPSTAGCGTRTSIGHDFRIGKEANTRLQTDPLLNARGGLAEQSGLSFQSEALAMMKWRWIGSSMACVSTSTVHHSSRAREDPCNDKAGAGVAQTSLDDRIVLCLRA